MQAVRAAKAIDVALTRVAMFLLSLRYRSDGPTFERRPAFDKPPTFERRPAFDKPPTFERRPAFDGPISDESSFNLEDQPKQMRNSQGFGLCMWKVCAEDE